MAELKAKIEVRAEDRSSAALDKVARGSKKLEERLAATRKEFAGLDRRDSAVRKLRSLSAGLGKTSADMDRARRRTAELGRQIAAAGSPTKKLQREFEAARRKSDLLGRAHRDQRDAVRNLRAELRGAGVDTRRLGDEQGRIAADLDRATRKMERMGEAALRVDHAQQRLDRSSQRAASASLVAGEVRNFGRAALRAVAAPIERMRQVERSRGELASLGMDRGEVEQVVRRGRDLMGKVAGITTPVFTGAAYDIRSGISSLDAGGVADMTELAALTAAATKADLGQMTDLFATGYGAFKGSLYEGAEDREFGEIFAAQLAKSVEAFKTDGSKMQQAIQGMGSGLAESGVAMEQQLAALGMLQQKMTAGEAGTAMSALERTAAQAQERFEQAGMGIRTLDGRGRMLAPSELLGEMQREFGQEYSTAIGAEIQKAFGSDEAVRFFKALWGQQDALERGAANLADAAAQGKDFVREMQVRAQGNMDARLELLQQRWDRVQEILGDSLVPTLDNWVIPALDRLIGGLEYLAEEYPEASGLLAAITGGVGLLALAISPAIVAVASLKWAIDRLRLSSARKALEGAAGGSGAPVAGGPRGGPRRVRDRVRDLARGGPRGVAGRIRGLAAGKGGKALKFLKGGGLLGAGIGALTIGGTLLDDELAGRDKVREITREAGGIGGALAGAVAGAALGSVVPVVGTAIGGILGGILGGMLGDSGGGKLGSALAGSAATRELAGETEGLVPALTRQRQQSREAAAAARARDGRGVNNTFNNRIAIQQQPGEDAQDLARRVLRELEHAQDLAGREALGDAY